MKIEGNGFLTTLLPDISQTVPGVNKALFCLLQDVINYAESLKESLQVAKQETDQEKQKIIATVTYIRLLEVVEAAFILSAYGIREELQSLFRIFLDAYFVHANCCSSPEFIPAYILSDEQSRLKMLNVATKYDSEMFKATKEYATAELKNQLENKIREEKIEAFNSYLYAKNVNCEQIYDSLYRLMSASVHTTPRCLSNYIETDEHGVILQVLHGSRPEDTNHALFDMSWFFLKAIRGICELFQLPMGTLDCFDKRIKEYETERKD